MYDRLGAGGGAWGPVPASQGPDHVPPRPHRDVTRRAPCRPRTGKQPALSRTRPTRQPSAMSSTIGFWTSKIVPKYQAARRPTWPTMQLGATTGVLGAAAHVPTGAGGRAAAAGTNGAGNSIDGATQGEVTAQGHKNLVWAVPSGHGPDGPGPWGAGGLSPRVWWWLCGPRHGCAPRRRRTDGQIDLMCRPRRHRTGSTGLPYQQRRGTCSG